MKKYNIVFFGSTLFSKISLESLYKNPKFNIQAVVINPDKPNLRGNKIKILDVKQFCIKNNISIHQPKKLKDIKEQLLPYNSDFFVVVSYGKIISSSILKIPNINTVNVHPSLLPKYRGPSPIQYALLNGDKKTAISIMLVSKKMDAGDILYQEDYEILPDIVFDDLYYDLGIKSAEILPNILDLYAQNKIQPISQDEKNATYTHYILKEMGKVDFKLERSIDIYNKYRAFTAWPSIYFFYNNKKIKITQMHILDKKFDLPDFSLIDKKLIVKTKDGLVVLDKVHPENKKEISGYDFYNGYIK